MEAEEATTTGRLSSLSAGAIEALRSLRTAAYWLASPFDAARRRLGGREPLPPLWLRRHTGPVRAFLPAARHMAATIASLGLVEPGDLVLDVGCGCGAMAPSFAAALGPGGRYVGFDVHQPSVAWCRRRFAADPRLRFEVAEIATPFSPGGAHRASEYVFPVADGAAGFVLAKSVFTHLLEPETRRYLSEVRRVLGPGRRALVTAFLFAPDTPTPAFPFPSSRAPVRWRIDMRPHAAVAYSRPLFEGMVRDAGLVVEAMTPGFWPGDSRRPTGQDVLVLSRI